MAKIESYKLWLVYIGIFALGLSSFIIMLNSSMSPEVMILGEWNEMKWEYEKVNENELDSLHIHELSEMVKKQLGHNLIVHKAEQWKFEPDGRLIMHGKNISQEIRWAMKGRGHILELKYANGLIESYSLTELKENQLVLNFETEMQARGIAKLTFEKIN